MGSRVARNLYATGALIIALSASLFTSVAQTFPYIPAGATKEAVKAQYETWKQTALTSANTADPATMLRTVDAEGITTSEAHAAAMLLSAFLEEDDATLKKLYNFAKSHFNKQGLMHYKILANDSIEFQASSVGGDLDIAYALDRAALRFPESTVDWEWECQKYLRQIQKYDKHSGVYTANTNGAYINHQAVSYGTRFKLRSGQDHWTVANAQYGVTVESIRSYGLPFRYVDMSGFPIMIDSTTYDPQYDRFATEGSRWVWRVALHKMVESIAPQPTLWVEALATFFIDTVDGKSDILNIKSSYRTSDKSPLSETNSPAMIGAAGIAAMAYYDTDSVGAKAVADAAWNYCSNYASTGKGSLEEVLRLLYMQVMSGSFDITDTTEGKYPPDFSLVVSPKSASIHDEGSDIPFNVRVYEGGYPIEKIELFQDGTLIHTIPGAADQYSYDWAWPSVPKGSYTITMKATDTKGRQSQEQQVTFFVGKAIEILPFNGSPVQIPGTITAVEFDNGGQDVAFWDSDPAIQKSDGGDFRSEGFDMQHTLDSNGDFAEGYNLSHTAPGEWVNYTIEITEDGTYDIGLLVATENTERQLEVAIDTFPDDVKQWNGQVLGTADVPYTAAWHEFEEVVLKDVELKSGVYRFRVKWVHRGVNLKRIRILDEISPSSTRVPRLAPVNMGQPRYNRHAGILDLRGCAEAKALKVTTLSGRAVAEYSGSIPRSIDMRRYSRGVYFVTLTGIDRRRMVYSFVR